MARHCIGGGILPFIIYDQRLRHGKALRLHSGLPASLQHTQRNRTTIWLRHIELISGFKMNTYHSVTSAEKPKVFLWIQLSQGIWLCRTWKGCVVDIVQHWLGWFACLTLSWDLRIGTCRKSAHSWLNLRRKGLNHLAMTQVAHCWHLHTWHF